MGTIIPFRERRTPQSFRELLQERVPVHVRALLAQGGPQESDWQAARTFSGLLGPKGDEMQFVLEAGTKRHKEASDNRDEMARHIAAMAFLPGGIRAFGLHFQMIDGNLSIEDAGGDAGQFLHLNARKTTGSYYTPRDLIECLLDSALEPVMEDAIRRSKQP